MRIRESQAAQQVNAALESLNIIPIVPRYDVAAYGTGSMKSFSFASDEILPAWWAHDPWLVDGDMSNCIGSCARSLQQIEATQCHFSCLCPFVCLCQCQCRSVFLKSSQHLPAHGSLYLRVLTNTPWGDYIVSSCWSSRHVCLSYSMTLIKSWYPYKVQTGGTTEGERLS